MKRIILDDNLILREYNRSIDRSNNSGYIRLKIEPKLGSVLSENLFKKSVLIDFFFDEKTNKDQWASIKNSTQQELVDYLGNLVVFNFNLVRDYIEWEKVIIYEDIMVPAYSQEENPQAPPPHLIKRGSKRKEFKHQEKIDDMLEKNRPLFSLIANLVSIGIEKPTIEEY